MLACVCASMYVRVCVVCCACLSPCLGSSLTPVQAPPPGTGPAPRYRPRPPGPGGGASGRKQPVTANLPDILNNPRQSWLIPGRFRGTPRGGHRAALPGRHGDRGWRPDGPIRGQNRRGRGVGASERKSPRRHAECGGVGLRTGLIHSERF